MITKVVTIQSNEILGIEIYLFKLLLYRYTTIQV